MEHGAGVCARGQGGRGACARGVHAAAGMHLAEQVVVGVGVERRDGVGRAEPRGDDRLAAHLALGRRRRVLRRPGRTEARRADVAPECGDLVEQLVLRHACSEGQRRSAKVSEGVRRDEKGRDEQGREGQRRGEWAGALDLGTCAR